MAVKIRTLFWCSLALAGAAPARAGAPRLALEQRAFDFGTVERGAKVEHTFPLPNRGEGVLLIDHVKSSCGCTVAVVSAHLLVTPSPLYLARVRRGDRTRHEVLVVPGRPGTSFAVMGVEEPVSPLLHAVLEPRPD